jgi:hypothetical protein
MAGQGEETLKQKGEGMASDNMFFGGIPTDIEVKKLREAYPDSELKPGLLISYEEVETVAGLDRLAKRSRWMSVTDRWRRNVESEVGVIIGPDPDGTAAFKVYTEGDKVGLSTKKLKTAGRMARRSYVVAARVDVKQLTEQEKANYEHNIHRSAAVLAAAKLKAKVALPEVV